MLSELGTGARSGKFLKMAKARTIALNKKETTVKRLPKMSGVTDTSDCGQLMRHTTHERKQKRKRGQQP
jgi:hypothetical protein